MGRLADGRVYELGYIIFDGDGRAQLHTMRANRAESWKAFFGRKMDRAERESWRARGFRCVFATVCSQRPLSEAS